VSNAFSPRENQGKGKSKLKWDLILTTKTLTVDTWNVPLNDKIVYIVGPGQLQNSLMASFLNEATGAKCLAVESLEKVPDQDDADKNNKCLVLLDCLGKDLESCLLDCDLIGEEAFNHILLALFNVSQTLGVEEKAISYGVKVCFTNKI